MAVRHRLLTRRPDFKTKTAYADVRFEVLAVVAIKSAVF
jgi:hypothetical protein